MNLIHLIVCYLILKVKSNMIIIKIKYILYYVFSIQWFLISSHGVNMETMREVFSKKGLEQSPRRNLVARRSWDEAMVAPRGNERLTDLLRHGRCGEHGSVSEYSRQFAEPASRALPRPSEAALELLQASSQHPLYSEAALTFWRHGLAEVQGASAAPPRQPSQPFRRNTSFTCPTQLVLDRSSDLAV